MFMGTEINQHELSAEGVSQISADRLGRLKYAFTRAYHASSEEYLAQKVVMSMSLSPLEASLLDTRVHTCAPSEREGHTHTNKAPIPDPRRTSFSFPSS